MYKFAILILLFSFELFSSPKILCEKGAFVDEEIHIQVVGLEPDQIIDIEARWNGRDQIQWISSAQFQADADGVVDLANHAPLKGSYEGIDPMGLFWSMQMGSIVPRDSFSESEEDEELEEGWFLSTNVILLDGNCEIGKKQIQRYIRKPEVEFIEVSDDGLVGELFIPPGEGPFPVVMVLTGSNGGIPSLIAQLLAKEGIAAFALAYSGVEGLPPDVCDVPLEYFEVAFGWLREQPCLNGKISLHGTSRGAELALLLASMFPDEIERIVCVAPSSVVLSPDSWTYQGESVLPAAPFMVDLNNDYNQDHSRRDQPESIKIYRERGYHLEIERYNAARLPVERIKCPIMLISGGDDQLGPCSLYAQQILERLDEHHSTIERIHLNYPDAGHLIAIPYFPRINLLCEEDLWITLGGTPMADELASRDAWKKTIEFLKGD